MLIKEIIAVYSQNHAKSINIKYSAADSQSMWYICVPLGFKRLMNIPGATGSST
jgi:hypothetical protein